MKYPVGLAIAALQLLSPLKVAKASSLYKTERCYTYVSTTSVRNIPTYSPTYTYYLTRTHTTTSTPTDTITPPATTQTVTLTTDMTVISTPSPSTETDTFTSTITSTTSTQTIVTLTETTVIRSTTTVTAFSTTTVATAAGFTPIAFEPAVIQTGGGSIAKRRSLAGEAAALEARGGPCQPQKVLCGLYGLQFPFNCPKEYPQEVSCTQTVINIKYQTETIICHPTTFTAPIPTSIATVTTTSTTTVVVSPPEASTTIFTTSVVTSTTTSTSTDTVIISQVSVTTVFAPDATAYAQCYSNNIIDNINGNTFIISYYIGLGLALSYPSIDDPLSCCKACTATNNCAGFTYIEATYNLSNSLCTLFSDRLSTDAMCTPSATYWQFQEAPQSEDLFYVSGNGQCGQGQYVPGGFS